MILADTSVWVDHLRAGVKDMDRLLGGNQLLIHPHVIGEIALGHLNPRDVILQSLSQLAHADTATDSEVLEFIERHKLIGGGIGYVEVHLLASTVLTSGAALWTRDKRLKSVAQRLGIAAAGLT
ncbi:MAG: VapC toxin family PIN domain ribonuclease [Alphaproteobacteria bacterium]|nr:VapC toxin family PIN domain ribonuclease [Alphaproteobacteria bacterium]